ncbi:hypothetical protein, partial [Bacteroides fragilis]|uniref:hypothetical protein n=1 Tax=Bacteroides fragilis TaxID=817 RepID=UPI0021D4797E
MKRIYRKSYGEDEGRGGGESGWAGGGGWREGGVVERPVAVRHRKRKKKTKNLGQPVRGLCGEKKRKRWEGHKNIRKR